MVVTDRYDHVIDEKNRLSIPASIRNAMDPERDGNSFYLIPGDRYLQLIPEKMFHQLVQGSTAGLIVPPEVAQARRLMFATASKLEPDKQGRVIVPERYMSKDGRPNPLSEAVLGREVTLVGVGDRVELWNRDDFAGHLKELLKTRPAVEAMAGQVFTAPAPVVVPVAKA